MLQRALETVVVHGLVKRCTGGGKQACSRSGVYKASCGKVKGTAAQTVLLSERMAFCATNEEGTVYPPVLTVKCYRRGEVACSAPPHAGDINRKNENEAGRRRRETQFLIACFTLSG